VFPDPGGLLPWGIESNHNYCCWLTASPPVFVQAVRPAAPCPRHRAAADHDGQVQHHGAVTEGGRVHRLTVDQVQRTQHDLREM
jgi:hypothetical protein